MQILRVRAHGQKKEFKCARCSKTFATNAYLKAHKQREEKLTAFSCDKCPFRAIQRAELNEHILTHTTQKGQSEFNSF
ncbi:ZN425-like protein [Mya arenaria]|uniref:ZN425-like protein n=1 Tax=Mya arenaria TaxID=6604 RepID=A0ABY7F5A5_MYAAR|nr:ZN425-like protein [Mya arenaria]